MKLASVLGVTGASFAAALMLMAADDVNAGASERGKGGTTQRRTMATPSAEPRTPALADPQILYLVRSTLLALEGANRTGNYSVLRDQATPEFQRRNSTADLAIAFANLRRQGVDLGPAAVLAPQLTAAAVPDAQSRVRLTGRLPVGPAPINFDIAFASVDGHWRLDGLAIDASPPQQTANQGAPPM